MKRNLEINGNKELVNPVVIDITHTVIDEDSKPKKQRKARARDLIWDAIIDITKINVEMYGAGRFAKEIISIKKIDGMTPEAIYAFNDWFMLNDWRGKKGQRPTIKNIKDLWGNYESSFNTISTITQKQTKTYKYLNPDGSLKQLTKADYKESPYASITQYEEYLHFHNIHNKG